MRLKRLRRRELPTPVSFDTTAEPFLQNFRMADGEVNSSLHERQPGRAAARNENEKRGWRYRQPLATSCSVRVSLASAWGGC
jgi:hypothetical protein